MCAKNADLVLADAVDNMPAFPKSARAILALTQDSSCSPKDFVQVIEKDPIVTVKVLRVANSAYYSLPNPISSIDHAVILLGFNTIKNLALSISSICMAPSNPLAGFDGHRYLMHSLVTAGMAKQLALHTNIAEPNECFTTGLLHDFGKVVVAQYMPEKFKEALERSLSKEIPLHWTLQDAAGVDDASIGAILVERWRFPTSLVETIRFQHQPGLCDSNMMTCVYAGHQISKHFGFAFGGGHTESELSISMAQRLGGTLNDVVASMGDLSPIVEEAAYFLGL